MKRPGPDSPAKSKLPTWAKGVALAFYPTDADKAIAVLYDLRDPAQWAAASETRRAWGRERSEIHVLDNDHIVIEFRAGGALEVSA